MLQTTQCRHERRDEMDVDLMLIFTIIVAAISGFVVLATTLLKISTSSAWRNKQAPGTPFREEKSSASTPDFDPEICFRECLEHRVEETGERLPYCREMCGLSPA
jgi:hypothetical protein